MPQPQASGSFADDLAAIRAARPTPTPAGGSFAADLLEVRTAKRSTPPPTFALLPDTEPLEPGNIDLFEQPSVPNPKGGRSTVASFSVNVDGREVLLPTVMPDGRLLSEDDAIKEYKRTGKHLGIFADAKSATAYATQLHEDYAAGKYRPKPRQAQGVTDPASVMVTRGGTIQAGSPLVDAYRNAKASLKRLATESLIPEDYGNEALAAFTEQERQHEREMLKGGRTPSTLDTIDAALLGASTGVQEGVQDVIRSMGTRLNIALAALGVGEAAILKRIGDVAQDIPKIEEALVAAKELKATGQLGELSKELVSSVERLRNLERLRLATRSAQAATGTAFTAEGAYNLVTAPTFTEKAFAVSQMAGGAAMVLGGAAGARQARASEREATGFVAGAREASARQAPTPAPDTGPFVARVAGELPPPGATPAPARPTPPPPPPAPVAPVTATVAEQQLAWDYLEATDPAGAAYAKRTGQTPLLPAGVPVEDVRATVDAYRSRLAGPRRDNVVPFEADLAAVRQETPAPTKHKFSSTQVNLPAGVAYEVSQLGTQIPDEDLAADGRETEPHITVQYGLDTEDVTAIRDVLKDEPPIRVRFGKTSHFADVEDGTADAVKVDVESEDLRRLRAKITSVIDAPGDTHPEYKPHATVAYVKPGLGKKYDGLDALEGQEVLLDQLTFSSRTGEQIEIPLTGAPKPALEPGPFGMSMDLLRADEELWRLHGAWVKNKSTRADRDALVQAFADRPELLSQIRDGIRAKWGDEFTVYRGDTDARAAEVTSWTFDPVQADKWAGFRGGAVHSRQARPEDIIGVGAMMEGEVFLVPAKAAVDTPARPAQTPAYDGESTGPDARAVGSVPPAARIPVTPPAPDPKDVRTRTRAQTADPVALRGLVARYDAREDFGNVVSRDNAKELFLEYAESPAGRTQYNDAVSDAAGVVADTVYAERLKVPPQPGAVVALTGGGPGSGKTTVIAGDAVAQSADVVFDSQSTDAAIARKRIDTALASGREVVRVFVYRDPADAWVNGVLPRAITTGRPVSSGGHLTAHANALQTAIALTEEYANDPRVQFRVYDNTGGRATPLPGDEAAAFLRARQEAYNDRDVRQRIQASTDALRAEGLLSDQLYRALSRGIRASTGSERPQDTPQGGGSGEGGSGAPSVPPDLRPTQVTSPPTGGADTAPKRRTVASDDWTKATGPTGIKAAAPPTNAAPNVTPNDIPSDLATRAHNGTSWVPESRGAMEQREYVKYMQAVWDDLQPRAKTPEQQATARTEFERYRSNYVNRYRLLLGRRSQLISAFIAGPSKFPTRQAEKRSNSYHKALGEFLEWDKRARRALLQAVDPAAPVSISADRPDAPEALQAKIDKAKQLQETMKAINKIVRTTSLSADEKVVRIVAEFHFKETTARKLLEPDFMGRVGFPDYELQNNLANIKRMEARIVSITTMRGTTERSATFEGGVIEENARENRIQVSFDAKPEAAIRDELKANGFHWSPTHGVWQRQRTDNAVAAVERIFGVRLAVPGVESPATDDLATPQPLPPDEPSEKPAEAAPAERSPFQSGLPEGTTIALMRKRRRMTAVLHRVVPNGEEWRILDARGHYVYSEGWPFVREHRVDVAPQQAHTTPHEPGQAAGRPVGDDRPSERPGADGEGAIADEGMGGSAGIRGFEPRASETLAQHTERLYQYVLADARAQAPRVAAERLRQYFDTAVEAAQRYYDDVERARTEDGRDPATLLLAIHKAGGLHDDELVQPMSKSGKITTTRRMTGELKWIAEGLTFGRVGTIRLPGENRPGYQLIRKPDRGETSFRQQGRTWDGMLEHLHQQPGFEHLENLNDLIDAVADAVRAVQYDEIRDTPAAEKLRPLDLQLGGIYVGEPWWRDLAARDTEGWGHVYADDIEAKAGGQLLDREGRIAKVRMPDGTEAWLDLADDLGFTKTATDAADPATSFDSEELEAQTGTPSVDLLDTGEAQLRLPEAGAARDQNVATPELEVPFSLTGEVDQSTKGAQTGFSFSKPESTQRGGGGAGEANVGAFAESAPVQTGTLPPPPPPTLFPPPPVSPSGRPTRIQPLEFPEVVDLARELQSTPKIVRAFRKVGKLGEFGGERGIRLAAELFTKGNEHQLAAALAHEIGHLVDWLPDKTLKRGNLLGRLLTLQSFLKQTFTAADGTTIRNAEIRKELTELSDFWRPWDPATASKSFRQYRHSGKELYADAISVLLNNPGLLEQRAPTFYKELFAALDRKPEVERAYFDLQEVLSGTREELIERRRAGVRRMFEEGDTAALDLERRRQREAEESRKNLWFRLKLQLVDKNYAVIDRVRALAKQGVRINPDDNPIYLLEERNYLGGKLKGFTERTFAPIYRAVSDADIHWNAFGEALLYERIIAGDRSELANPRGLSPAAVREMYDVLKRELGPAKARVLTEQVGKFRDTVKEVAEEAYQAGLYTEDLHQQMMDNPAYATYQVIEHLEAGVTSRVYQQVGTLKDIVNPADATVLKTLVTLRAIEHNRVKAGTVDFLTKHFPSDIEDAKSVWTGKGHRPVEPRDRNQRLVTYFKTGKLVGKYVDPYVADMLENARIGQNLAVVAILRRLNSGIFRPVFTTFNLGFQSYNFARDFGRFWKNVPNMTLRRALRRYWEAVPLAKVRAFGLSQTPDAKEVQAYKDLLDAEESMILSVTFNDVIRGREIEDTQIEDILSRMDVAGFHTPKRARFARPFMAILDAISELGDFIETLPKAAGIYEFKGSGPISAIGAAERSHIRRKLGSPDFLAGGTAKPITNELLLFSNAITQAWRSDFEVATDPKTRSGFWWKTATVNLLPKVLMLAATLGLMGETLRRLYERMTEYDRTNYVPIPLGEDEEGNVVYVRLPQDDSGRLIGGLFWKLLRGAIGDPTVGETATQVLDYTAGQFPSVSPAITTARQASEMVGGQNPRDSFRGRNLLTEDEHKAGGWRAWKKFLGWEFQNWGGGIVWKFYPGEDRPREQTRGQWVLELPIISNIVGRFIRITDYGTTEDLRATTQRAAGEDASRRLDEREAVNEVVRQYLALPDGEQTPRRREMMAREVAERLYGQDRAAYAERLPDLRIKLRVGALRGEADPLVDAVLSATSTHQKMAVLERAAEQMGATTFEAWLMMAVRERVISRNVYAAVRRAQAREGRKEPATAVQ